MVEAIHPAAAATAAHLASVAPGSVKAAVPHSLSMIGPMLNAELQEQIIIGISIFAILYGILNAILVLRIKVV